MPWVRTLFLLVIEIRMIRKRMSKVLIRTWGLAYTSNVDHWQCRPTGTKFMKASSNFLMLTSRSENRRLAIQVGALRFGSPVTRTLGCSEEYKSLTGFEARGLHLVPFGGRCAFCCGGLSAPVPTDMQSVSHSESGRGTFGLKIHLRMQEALQEHSQISGLRGR